MDLQQSFNEYVAGHLTALSRAAFLLTGDRHAAEDLVQATLLQVARHWNRTVASGAPDGYVRRVMYSQHVSMWRRRWRTTELHADPPHQAVSDRVSELATAIVVRDALARLTAKQRAVLVLRFFEDQTETAAAEVLGCSVSTIKTQTRAALGRLRAIAPELAGLHADPNEPAIDADDRRPVQ